MRGSNVIEQEIQLFVRWEKQINGHLNRQYETCAPTQFCPVIVSAVNALQALSELSDIQQTTKLHVFMKHLQHGELKLMTTLMYLCEKSYNILYRRNYSNQDRWVVHTISGQIQFSISH
jgi:hypothetical protein